MIALLVTVLEISSYLIENLAQHKFTGNTTLMDRILHRIATVLVQFLVKAHCQQIVLTALLTHRRILEMETVILSNKVINI